MAIAYDFLIVGAGIVGLAIADRLRALHADATIAIVDKEADVAMHASGRNSGVLHAGFYYTADSLKAKLTVQGNQMMRDFVLAHGLPLNPCGKLVVATTPEEVAGLEILYQRGVTNGAEVSLIDAKAARDIDPAAFTIDRALFSPNTACVDPVAVCNQLKENLQRRRVDFLFGEPVVARKGQAVYLGNGQRVGFGLLINAAGLYADKIAQLFGVGMAYTMMPFKGLYLKYGGDASIIRTHIYPVPNIENPFLGVHFTKTVAGDVKIGPTAMPAFWREHYGGLSGFRWGEFYETVYHQARLFWSNAFGFRRLAWQELNKARKRVMIRESQRLVPGVKPDFKRMRAGIRAQLLHKADKRLVMDFMVESGPHSVHVLNAVSPAFTCGFSFADYVVSRYIEQRS